MPKKAGFIPERDPDRPRRPADNGEIGEDIESIRESDEDPTPQEGTAESLTDADEDSSDDGEPTITFSLKAFAMLIRELFAG